MAENNKIYITANELAEMLGVSVGHAYKLIRKLNEELEKEGFLEDVLRRYGDSLEGAYHENEKVYRGAENSPIFRE